jgi:hypothetical protein
MPAEINYCYRKNDQIICKDLGDGPALIDPYRRTLVKLNPTAHKIWQLLDGGHSAAAIIDILENEFQVDAKILEKDVIRFIKGLARREMIK